MLNKDFSEMLQCLLDENVDFLLIGGYAMAAHGYPRATKDIDLWVAANPANAKKIMRALQTFGAPMMQVSEDDFAEEGCVFQIGVPPRRIDLTTLADGVDFVDCHANAVHVEIDGLFVPLIALADLIRNKQASGRPQDLVDVGTLAESK